MVDEVESGLSTSKAAEFIVAEDFSKKRPAWGRSGIDGCDWNDCDAAVGV